MKLCGIMVRVDLYKVLLVVCGDMVGFSVLKC